MHTTCPSYTSSALHTTTSTQQVKDVKTGDCYRADHLLEGALEGALEDTKNPLSKEAAFVSG